MRFDYLNIENDFLNVKNRLEIIEISLENIVSVLEYIYKKICTVLHAYLLIIKFDS